MSGMEELEKLVADLEKKLRNQEIRTPMNAITGMTYLLKQTDPSPRQVDYITKIQTSVHALLRIINDILDISKIEAGRLDLLAPECK